MEKEESFIDLVNKQLTRKKNVLPVFDRTSMRIQQELVKKEPDIQSIEKLIVTDQSLVGQVLGMANSAFYKGLVKVSTIHNAILRIGITEVSNIVMMAAH